MSTPLPDIGAVVIGRNEGARLLRCLDSLRAEVAHVVYADSDSSDGSAAAARARGVEVVGLDRSRPLNAARGRNAGLARLRERWPALRYVFFVDGDCEVVSGFLVAARVELERDPRLGAVCGRRRELHPEASPYNRIVDCEWNTPLGAAQGFGGDVLVRLSALEESGGYDEALNQGEDPELAFRLHLAGWGIQRIAHEMTRHDVALLTLSAWRRRHRRGGYAYAHGAAKHWRDPGRYNQRACLSILGFGIGLPCVALLGAPWTFGLSLFLIALSLRPWSRIRRERLARGDSRAVAGLYATWITLGKFEEARGVLRCCWDLLWRRQTLTLEYKPGAAAPASREAA
jgi:GT2 family glycosyltransferase